MNVISERWLYPSLYFGRTLHVKYAGGWAMGRVLSLILKEFVDQPWGLTAEYPAHLHHRVVGQPTTYDVKNTYVYITPRTCPSCVKANTCIVGEPTTYDVKPTYVYTMQSTCNVRVRPASSHRRSLARWLTIGSSDVIVTSLASLARWRT